MQQSEEENADEEFDFRPAAGAEEDHSEQFMSRWYHLKRQKDRKLKDIWPKRQKNPKGCSLLLKSQREKSGRIIKFSRSISCLECNFVERHLLYFVQGAYLLLESSGKIRS